MENQPNIEIAPVQVQVEQQPINNNGLELIPTSVELQVNTGTENPLLVNWADATVNTNIQPEATSNIVLDNNNASAVDNVAAATAAMVAVATTVITTTNVNDTANTEYKEDDDDVGISLYLPEDDNLLSEFQIIVRQQLEFFTAKQQDVEDTKQGRKRKTQIGQVGIRCIQCSNLPLQKYKNL